MDYQDFTIDIRSAGNDQFEATVVDAPIRENPRLVFRRPFPQESLAGLLQTIDQRVRDELEDDEVPKPLVEMSPREVGEQLYTTLIQGAVADLFESCRISLPRDGRTGLRLRLKFHLDDPEVSYLTEVPWEWLWDPRTAAFLATGRKTPIVRDYSTRHFQTALAVEAPLRILVADANPCDLPRLNLRRELERMAEALGPLQKEGWVKLFHLKETTPEALRNALLDREIHVLHFMGHGGYHAGTGYGAVFFVKPDRKRDEVSGLTFADYLKDIPDLRLVVLNACRTARHAGATGAPHYYGVAAALLDRAGVPAVVANQYAISDEAAIKFSAAFYRRIASGDHVEAALSNARLELARTSREWATPVLFLGAEQGKLFEVTPPKGIDGIEEIDAQKLAKEPVRLGIRSIVGHGADMEARNFEVLNLVPSFKGRAIREPGLWQSEVFPKLRDFLARNINPHRPVELDFAAHSSIAFAAGWLLESKSGLDVRVIQRTSADGHLTWHPNEGPTGEEPLWLDRPDLVLLPEAPDVALAMAVSQPEVAGDVEAFLRDQKLPVGRIIDAVISPEPGMRSVLGGAHALRLAQSLLPRLRRRAPHERSGTLHLFCAAPNALLFYLGQLARFLDRVVLYEYVGSGRYDRAIELPPPEAR
jgi:hypothetical protein